MMFSNGRLRYLPSPIRVIALRAASVSERTLRFHREPLLAVTALPDQFEHALCLLHRVSREKDASEIAKRWRLAQVRIGSLIALP